jgi:hypothetical protein
VTAALAPLLTAVLGVSSADAGQAAADLAAQAAQRVGSGEFGP